VCGWVWVMSAICYNVDFSIPNSQFCIKRHFIESLLAYSLLFYYYYN